MINHLLLICTSVVIYELFRFFQFIHLLNSNFKIYKKIFKLLNTKKASDFRKEKLLFSYSKLLFNFSIKILLILFLIVILIFGLDLLSLSFLNLIISILGITELTIVIILYHQLRKKINGKLY